MFLWDNVRDTYQIQLIIDYQPSMDTLAIESALACHFL